MNIGAEERKVVAYDECLDLWKTGQMIEVGVVASAPRRARSIVNA